MNQGQSSLINTILTSNGLDDIELKRKEIRDNEEEIRDKYKTEVIKLLKKQLKKRTNNIKTHVSFSNNERKYTFDLIVTNNTTSYNSPKKTVIYELYTICYFSDYIFKSNALLIQLRHYQQITDASVYVVFKKDDDNKLCVLSLEELELENEKNNKIIIVGSFVDFYYNLIRIIHYNDKRADSNRLFYRGQANNTYEAIPSVYRDSNIKNEGVYYHEATRILPNIFTENMTTFDNLVLMQHYEIPTRLLDITNNPLVALFFACQPAYNKDGTEVDGEVLIYPVPDENIAFYDSDYVSILANLSKCPANFCFEEQKNQLVYNVKKDKPNFNGNKLRKKDIQSVLCVLPKLNNDRIVKQDGAFFIFGMGEKKGEAATIPELPYIINIKSSEKCKILYELKLLGINESTLFPETDKIMKQVKNDISMGRSLPSKDKAALFSYYNKKLNKLKTTK